MENISDFQLLNLIRQKGNCAVENIEPELFFDEEDTKGFYMERLPVLRKICGNCVVRNECLEYALRNDVQGFWGSTTHQERRAIRRRSKILPKSVTFDAWIPKISASEEEDIIDKYLSRTSVCRNGHPIKTKNDINFHFNRNPESYRPYYIRCKKCVTLSSIKYNSKVKASQIEAQGLLGGTHD
jgi:WhiB family redox-sensing transcriptional regulator